MSVKRRIFVTAIATTALLLGACSGLPLRRNPASVPVPIESLSEVNSVASERVIVRTDLLRGVLKSQRSRDEKCRDAQNQLKGLKSLDLQHPQGVK